MSNLPTTSSSEAGEQHGKRNLEDWIQGYLDYTEDQESPEQIHFWTALSVLSAAMRRQVYIDMGGVYKLFPNIYVLIVGESAKIRKSVAMEMGIKLLEEAVPDIFILRGRTTPEAVVKYANRTNITQNGMDPTKAVIRQDSHFLLYADELATLFGYDRIMASRMSILLTDIYSSKDKYPHLTKGDAPIILHNLYPTLLAATDPRNLKVLPEDAVGGLLGRTIFVVANKRRRKNAWPELSKRENLWRDLVVDLARISSLKGTFTVTKEARELFTKWYDKFTDREVNDPRLDAFMERGHDTARKISMLISLSRSNSLIISAEHMAGGIAVLEKQIEEFTKSMEWTATTIYSQNRMKLLDLLKRRGGVASRRVLMKAMNISRDDMDTLQISLEQEGSITVAQIGNDFIFKITAEEVIKDKPN